MGGAVVLLLTNFLGGSPTTSAVIIAGPYSVAAAGVFAPGALVSQVFVGGGVAGQALTEQS